MIWDFFKNWSKVDLQEQELMTKRKLNSLNTMLSENPDNIFLKSQINSELKKLNSVQNNLKQKENE